MILHFWPTSRSIFSLAEMLLHFTLNTVFFFQIIYLVTKLKPSGRLAPGILLTTTMASHLLRTDRVLGPALRA